jgi:hypothetical protein
VTIGFDFLISNGEIPIMAHKLGKCAACAYEPVARGAKVCPRCGVSNPNPGLENRLIGWSMLLGMFVCGLIGTIWGFCTSDTPEAGALGGGIVGAILGFVLGLGGGIVFSAIAWFVELMAGLFHGSANRAPRLPVEEEYVEREERPAFSVPKGGDSIQSL